MKPGDRKAIIFDMGGTIYDTKFEPYPIHIRFLEELDIIETGSLSEEVFAKIHETHADVWFDNYAIENRVGQHWDPDDAFWFEFDKHLLRGVGVKEEVLDEIAIKFQQKWNAYLKSPDCQSCFIESCRPVLEEIQKQGYKMGIASNRFTDPNPRLKEDGILQFFDAVEYTATPGYAKPNPYLLIRVAARLGVNPLRCVYVGNKVRFDVEASRRAGMIPVLITWCTPEEAKLAGDGTIVIGHMDRLLTSIRDRV